MHISSIQEQVILGSLLGDASIHKDKRYGGYEFSEKHSLKQKEYLLWKNQYLNFRFKEYSKHKFCIIRKNNKIFGEYKNLFYIKNKKVVTKEVLNKLESLALAIWYMDDEDYHYNSGAIRLATHSFHLDGNKIISNWLNKRWGIKSKIRRNYDKRKGKEYFYLEMNRENSNLFITLIEKHIIQSMHYKIGLDKERREKSNIKKKEYNKTWRDKNKDKIKGYYIKRKQMECKYVKN